MLVQKLKYIASMIPITRRLVINKLAKARKTRKSGYARFEKSLGRVSFGSKNFEPKIFVSIFEIFWAQNISIEFCAELDNVKKMNFLFFPFFFRRPTLPKKKKFGPKILLLIFSLNWMILRKTLDSYFLALLRTVKRHDQ